MRCACGPVVTSNLSDPLCHVGCDGARGNAEGGSGAGCNPVSIMPRAHIATGIAINTNLTITTPTPTGR